MDVNCVKLVACNSAQAKGIHRIIDSGATHHITGCVELLNEVKRYTGNSCTHVPNGETALVSH